MDFGAIVVAGVAGGMAGALGHLITKATTREGSSERITAAHQGVIIAAIVGFSAGFAQVKPLTQWVNLHLGLKSRLDIVMEAEGERLLANPKFKALIKGKAPGEAKAVAAGLAARGIQHLDPPDLELWAHFKLRIADASLPLCAALWKGNADGDAVVAVLATFSDPDLETWARISSTASLRALDKDPVPPDQAVLDEGIKHILEQLPETERQRVGTNMTRQDLDDGTACELLKLVLTKGRQFPQPERTRFLHALAQL